MRSWEKGMFTALGTLLGVSLMTTLILLALEGRWAEAIPLHLCSVSALVSLRLAFFPAQTALDFLWYLGIPGAVLALLFPAPAISRLQMILDASYMITHALIVTIPLLCMILGWRPAAGKTPRMMLALFVLAAFASLINGWFGTDFLFLSAPPAGTPLEYVFALGYPLYLAALGTMMLLLCMAMDALAARLQTV